MAFSKFDPARPVVAPADEDDASARRRALLLRYGGSVARWMMYLGFAVIAYEIGHQRGYW